MGGEYEFIKMIVNCIVFIFLQNNIRPKQMLKKEWAR